MTKYSDSFKKEAIKLSANYRMRSATNRLRQANEILKDALGFFAKERKK